MWALSRRGFVKSAGAATAAFLGKANQFTARLSRSDMRGDAEAVDSGALVAEASSDHQEIYRLLGFATMSGPQS
jgi:hypothetical protein